MCILKIFRGLRPRTPLNWGGSAPPNPPALEGASPPLGVYSRQGSASRSRYALPCSRCNTKYLLVLLVVLIVVLVGISVLVLVVSEILDGSTFFYRKKAHNSAVSSLKVSFFRFFGVQTTDFAPCVYDKIFFFLKSEHYKLLFTFL